MPIISIENVSKRYRQGQKVINASQDINLNVEPGEFIVVIGPSGSGKSTLLQLLGGLDRPDSGKITLDGTEYLKSPKRVLQRCVARSSALSFKILI